MGELGTDWLREVGVMVPVTGDGPGGGNNQAWPLCWPLVSSNIVCVWMCLHLRCVVLLPSQRCVRPLPRSAVSRTQGHPR
jgi:hypothetical protein